MKSINYQTCELCEVPRPDAVFRPEITEYARLCDYCFRAAQNLPIKELREIWAGNKGREEYGPVRLGGSGTPTPLLSSAAYITLDPWYYSPPEWAKDKKR